MKISIVIATRNSEKTITKCLSSMMPDKDAGLIDEIIVIDGQSNDKTREIVQKYPVRLLDDIGNGVFSAFDTAWRKTKAEWIVFIDSDAYIENGFIPGLTTFFVDERIGILGCRAKGCGTGIIGKAINQWWEYHGDSLKIKKNKTPSNWKRLYYLVTGYSKSEQPNTSGPCYAVRRQCLEQVNGFSNWTFLYDKYPRLLYPGDIFLSQDVIDAGWMSRWWVDAPVFHHPPEKTRELLRQRIGWGQGDRELLRVMDAPIYKRLFPLIVRLGAPIWGAWFAFIYRNPVHIVLFPLAHFSWIIGFIGNKDKIETK